MFCILDIYVFGTLFHFLQNGTKTDTGKSSLFSLFFDFNSTSFALFYA
jgi:hypothetical protein